MPLVLLVLLSLLAVRDGRAQEVDTTGQALPADTTAAPPAGATAGTQVDTLRAPSDPSTTLDEPVTFQARDSLVLFLGEPDGQDRGTLAGEASVTYGDAKLEAHAIDILFDRDELRARGLPSDTGLVGRPHFSQGEESFYGTELAYNLRTERGRVVGVTTQIEDGFIRAGVVKVGQDSTLYIQNGEYTTCECGPGETPSYSLRSDRMKIVDEKWIYTGPIQLFLFNIPTPLWLPFGFLPAQEGRRSGPLPPEYGEDQRGFYLRNWGWYWALSDYMDLQVRGGLWTKGSWQVAPTFRYALRDRYEGGLSVDYLRERSGERGDPDLQVRNSGSLRWNHRQDLNPTTQFTANVNLASSGYLRTVSENYQDRVRQTVMSAVRYDKRWPTRGRSFSINLTQNHVLATGQADLTLPQLTFNQSTRTPFKRRTRAPGQDERWYERLTISYNATLDNEYRFSPDTAHADISWYEALVSPSKFRLATGEDGRFDFRTAHRLPIAAPFTVNRIPLLGTPFRLNVSPNFTYTEDWFIESERRSVDTTGRVQTTSVPGFVALRQFSTGVSANTTFYGLFPVRVGPYAGVRHTVRPTVSFTYRPDFASDFWGYARTFVNAQGREEVYGIVPGVQRPLQQALSFSVSNVFETKRVDVDSTGEARGRTLKLFNLDASTSYNFAADSMKLTDIQLSARTRVLGKMNVNLSAGLSPYALSADGRSVIDRYLFFQNLMPFRLTRVNLSADFSLSGGGGDRSASRFGPSGYGADRTVFDEIGGSDLGVNQPYSSYDPYGYGGLGATDFSIPWSLDFQLTYGFSKTVSFTEGLVSRPTATVNTGFDFNVTPFWKVQAQTGYDLVRGEPVTTNLYLMRDLDCWEMAFRWVPFGQFQSYGFDLHVKSGKLRDILRLRQPRSDVNRGFGGV